MAKELYHFHFRRPHQPLKFSTAIWGTTLFIVLTILAILQFSAPNPKYNIFFIFLEGGLPVLIILWILTYFMAKARGGDVDESEFILYDNGWFAFWDLKFQDWIAPAKLDWLYPPELVLKPLKGSKNGYYVVKKKNNGRNYVVFRLTWGYPYGKWKCWIFYDKVYGWLTEEEYKRLEELVTFLIKKARENVESGRMKRPEGDCKQAYVDIYQQPPYWDEVFEKENIRELYRKETGEDIPEPIRSYLFDTKTFDKVYLKNKRETGNWLGRGEKE